MIFSTENPSGSVRPEDAARTIAAFFARNNYAGKRVLLIVPDNTRSGPIGMIFQMIFDCIGQETEALDILVALGTHQGLSEEQICKRLSLSLEQRRSKYASVKFFNHDWHLPETFKTVGTISADDIHEISEGLFKQEVPVAVNKLIFDYDEVFIVGPVFPHEVVGFSGGNKYLFPGIAGAEIINFFHWLGAMITNPKINGAKWTATRAVVEKAASMIDAPRKLFAVVALEDQLKGLFVGDVVETWEKAADLSEQVHITFKDKPFSTVLGLAPEMYDDIWTAGKVMYKLEPIVADGGTLIIYAPHITEISYTHGKILDEIGYHTRDYFLNQWEKFKHYPWGVIAHSTHVKGIGACQNGKEMPRVNVVLATRIPEQRCKQINLGYMDPDGIDVASYRNREDEGVLVVDHAGEQLHHLR